MKTKEIIISLLSPVLLSCGGNQTDSVISINPAESFQEKELIAQKFLDVEYVKFETKDDFVTQGDVMTISNNYIIAKNYGADGNIFVFDRETGKALTKFNNRGQGAEEYTSINGIFIDEKNDELFVNDTMGKKVLVLNTKGNFIRSFKLPEGTEVMNMGDYDDLNFICYDMTGYYRDGEERNKPYYHFLVSKKDGSITKGIHLPFEKINSPFVQKGDGIALANVSPITPSKKGYLLIETSSDTIYNYSATNDKLTPFAVKAHSDNPVYFITVGTVTENYIFLKTTKKDFDFSKGTGFPTEDLVYDKTDGNIYEASVVNEDYPKGSHFDLCSHPVNREIATFQVFSASKLIEAYNENLLNGKLKEIAATLDEEDNPVIAILREKE